MLVLAVGIARALEMVASVFLVVRECLDGLFYVVVVTCGRDDMRRRVQGRLYWH
jgi:hypothetical protein